MLRRLAPLLVPALVAGAGFGLFEFKFRREMPDFQVYYRAATRARHAEPLYRPEDGHYQHKYLPASAIFMLPLSRLAPETAQVAWFALSLGCLITLVRWSVRFVPARRREIWILTTLTVISMAKFYGHELTLGQANLLYGVMLVGAIGALDLDSPIVAGALIGLATFIKPYAIIFLPWLLVVDRRAIGACLGMIVFGLVLPAAIYGWSGNIDLHVAWYRTVTDTTAPLLTIQDNVSLAGMWAKWLGGGSRLATVAAALTGAALLGLVALVWTKRREVDEPIYLEGATLMLLIPLLSPQGWDYILLLATPAVALTFDRWTELGRPWQWLLGTALVVMGLTQYDLMGRALYGRFMATSAITVAAMILAAGLWRMRQIKLA